MWALSATDIQRLVSMRQAIDLVKSAFAELSSGHAEVPLRSSIGFPGRDGVTLFMPASVPSIESAGVKIVSVFPNNPNLGKSTISALMIVTSVETGEPLALLDGTFLTALRTGAASGAATELLARPESSVLTVFGAGAQGLTQAWAIATVRPIERVYVCDISDSARSSFAERLAGYDADLATKVVPAADMGGAARESDIICTATTSRRDVFDGADVRPGTHINAIGAFTPEMQEVPIETVASARLVVDSIEAVMAEAGDLLKAIEAGALKREDVSLELGQLVADQSQGRQSPDEITLFKAVGVAVQDVVVANYAAAEAERQGIGQIIEL